MLVNEAMNKLVCSITSACAHAQLTWVHMHIMAVHVTLSSQRNSFVRSQWLSRNDT